MLDIAKEMKVGNVCSIMLLDNYRALSLTKKMGFTVEYLNDGTVKGVLDLKEEDLNERCHNTQTAGAIRRESAEKRFVKKGRNA